MGDRRPRQEDASEESSKEPVKSEIGDTAEISAEAQTLLKIQELDKKIADIEHDPLINTSKTLSFQLMLLKSQMESLQEQLRFLKANKYE